MSLSETSFLTDVFGNLPGLADAQSKISCHSGHSFLGNQWEAQRPSHRIVSNIDLYRLTLTTDKGHAGGSIFELLFQNAAGNLLLCCRGVRLQHLLHPCGSSADVCFSSTQLGPTSRTRIYCHHWRLLIGIRGRFSRFMESRRGSVLGQRELPFSSFALADFAELTWTLSWTSAGEPQGPGDTQGLHVTHEQFIVKRRQLHGLLRLQGEQPESTAAADSTWKELLVKIVVLVHMPLDHVLLLVIELPLWPV